MTIRLVHLVVLIAAVTVAAAVGSVFATYWVIEDEVQDLLDDDLEAQSELLAHVLAAEPDLVSAVALDELVVEIFEPDQEETLWINVYDPAGGRRVSNLDHALPEPAAGSGPVSLELGGHRWFGYQHSEAGGPIVQLLHRRDRYREVREEVLEGVVGPALVVTGINLLLLAVLFWLFVGPLTRLARELERRQADSLAPLAVRTPAREVRVLGKAVNGLMADVEAVLSRERAFASDVAHELRTPLTTLKLELSSGDPDLVALSAEVDRLVGLVNQLLTLARLQRSQWRQAFEGVDLEALCRVRLREEEARFEAAGLTLEAELAPVTVDGDRTLLEILLGNLLANVRRHCPPGTTARVTLREEGGSAVLWVEDTGPGLGEAERARLDAGASRLDQRGRGLGLGLTICHKIAAVHGASLRFCARPDGKDGLRVVVRFAR